MPADRMPPLIADLLKPGAYTHAADAPQLIETHISWVILAGDYAYKIKKPLNLGFLDFPSLELRHRFYTEEVRLNQHLAPDIYLAAVAITGTPEYPHMAGTGEAIEWAVKMRAFPAQATLDRETDIRAEQIDAIAERIAEFHAGITVAPANSNFGQPASITEPVNTNFSQLHTLLPPPAQNPLLHQLLDKLAAWSQAEGERLSQHFAKRKTAGFIRECHGDLHLGNIAWVAGAALIFDALEFNPALRQIDVISEIAFLSMDLQHRQRADLAWRLLDRYLEHTGDFDGLAALPYYQVYRAMVRAKVAAILAVEHPRTTPDFSDCLTYLKLAERLTHTARPALLLMHGVSGSGKTWLSQHLLEQLGMLRLRSDVTRKRLFGLKPLQDSGSIAGGIYSSEASARTLASLLADARNALDAGFSVIVDATFIHRTWRAPFQALAQALAIPWHIVAVTAPSEVLQARISQRKQAGGDASEAGHDVLKSQLAHLEPFTVLEQTHVIHFSNNDSADAAIAQLRSALNIHPTHDQAL